MMLHKAVTSLTSWCTSACEHLPSIKMKATSDGTADICSRLVQPIMFVFV